MFCKKRGPDITTAGDLKVSFRSDKKKQDTGAKCKVECVDETTTGDSTTEDYTTEDTTGPITTGDILTTLEPV